MSVIDERVLVKIAHYYYENALTQEQIANKMHMSRQKVNRLIKRLLVDEIVTINIKSIIDYNIHLENRLEQVFGLEQAIVVKADAGDLMDRLGIAASNYLAGVIENGMTIGVAWGRGLHSIARNLTPSKFKGVSVVQIAGGMTHANVSKHADEIYQLSAEIVRLFSDKLKATPYLMYAPIFVETAQIRDALMSDQTIRNTVEKTRSCDIVLTGVGAVSADVTPFKYGHLPLDVLHRLKEMGCVGNLCFRYYDIDGKVAHTELDSRTIAPTIEELKRIPLTVGIAGGMEKRDAILGALRGKFIDVLVVDETTAESVLEIEKNLANKA